MKRTWLNLKIGRREEHLSILMLWRPLNSIVLRLDVLTTSPKMKWLANWNSFLIMAHGCLSSSLILLFMKVEFFYRMIQKSNETYPVSWSLIGILLYHQQERRNHMPSLFEGPTLWFLRSSSFRIYFSWNSSRLRMTCSACARFSCDSSVPADDREEFQSNFNLLGKYRLIFKFYRNNKHLNECVHFGMA